MHVFTRRSFLAVVFAAALLATPAQAANPRSCLRAIAVVTLAAAFGLNVGAYVKNQGRYEGYQRALADVSKIFEKKREMTSEEEGTASASPLQRFRIAHQMVNDPYFKEHLAALSDSDRVFLRIAIVSEKLRLLKEIFGNTEAESLDKLLERSGLPKDVVKEINEKGLFDGVEFWSFELVGEAEGEFTINLVAPDSVMPYFKKLKEKEDIFQMPDDFRRSAPSVREI